MVYLYTVVAFNFFRKFYNKSEDDDEPDMKCDDMMTVRARPPWESRAAGGWVIGKVETYRCLIQRREVFWKDGSDKYGSHGHSPKAGWSEKHTTGQSRASCIYICGQDVNSLCLGVNGPASELPGRQALDVVSLSWSRVP